MLTLWIAAIWATLNALLFALLMRRPKVSHPRPSEAGTWPRRNVA